MKIALMFGKGRDGCGVQKIGTEMLDWATLSVDHECDFYSLDERKFARGLLNEVSNYISFDKSTITTVAKDLEKYDIVIFHSYPSAAHDNDTIKLFYDHIIKGVEHPIKVMFMHELNKTNIDKVPYVVPILNEADIIYTFGTETWLSTTIPKFLKSKIQNERIRKFTMMFEFENIMKYRRPLKDLTKQIQYVGRWTTMKDPRRILDWQEHFWNAGIKTQMIGLERSIGMKCDLLDHPNNPIHFKVHKPCLREDLPPLLKIEHENQTRVPIIGEFPYDWAMENYVSKSLFGCSFYRLPKDPTGYADRMEYTQIEIIAIGNIPVFDKHWGEHNHTHDGRRFIDVPYSAVYSDKENPEETIKMLTEIADSAELQEKYRKVSLELIRDEYDINIAMPRLLEEIMTIGKDENKYQSDSELLLSNNAENLEDYLISQQNEKTIVVMGFNEIENDYTRFLEGRKEVESGHKKPIADSFADFF